MTPGPKGGMVLVGSGLSEVDKVALKNWLLRQVGVAGVSHEVCGFCLFFGGGGKLGDGFGLGDGLVVSRWRKGWGTHGMGQPDVGGRGVTVTGASGSSSTRGDPGAEGRGGACGLGAVGGG